MLNLFLGFVTRWLPLWFIGLEEAGSWQKDEARRIDYDGMECSPTVSQLGCGNVVHASTAPAGSEPAGSARGAAAENAVEGRPPS